MKYNTMQKNELIMFFKKNKEKGYTAGEIADYISVGKSTIYRLLPELVSNGIIKRFSSENSNSVLYQFIDDCGKCKAHLHMKCTDCGKILHMDKFISDHILRDILNTEAFAVNERDTILFGKCSDCSHTKDKEGF